MSDSVQKNSFWRRQFSPEATELQNAFDWIMGIALPIFCLVTDPILFRPDGILDLEKSRTFVYLWIGAGIVTLALWLSIGDRIRRVSRLVACILLLGTLCAFAIGIVLFPFSVIGLRILIGLFGFVPFFTGFAFLRNGVRAMQQANVQSRRNLMGVKTTACLIAPIVIFGALVLWVSQVRAYLSATTYQERALQQIIQDTIRGGDRFVVDEPTRSYARPRTAISQPAWKVLISHSEELPGAVTSITTKGTQGDTVESEIWINTPSTTLRCHSSDGDVLYTSFYVYTCTVVVGTLP
jgi:hypothetical protein